VTKLPLGANSASYPVGTVALSLGVEWLGHEADHLHPSNAKVKNAGSYMTATYVIMLCLFSTRDSFIIFIYFVPTAILIIPPSDMKLD
jgi:hypothetical protein